MTITYNTPGKRRWSDTNYHLGPFTWSPESRGGHGLGVMLDSGTGERPGCHVRFYLPFATILAELPPIIQPKRKKVYPNWDAATVERLGRDFYYDEHKREFGFNFSDNTLHVHYGAQTHSWPGCASKCFFLPWLSWRFIRHTHFTPDGERIRTYWDDLERLARRRARKHKEHGLSLDDIHFARTLPTVDFLFRDFDGEEITCKARIEEREWRFGTGWFSWLSLFWPKKIRRSANLEFTSETGKRKGSWKGGTIGAGIEMDVGEPLESAFRRYCRENNMTFIASAPPPPPQDGTAQAMQIPE